MTPNNADENASASAGGSESPASCSLQRSLAEASGDALAVAASMYRMAHVFLSLDQIGPAQQVAATTAAALEPFTKARDATSAAQSLYGACQLVLAIKQHATTTAPALVGIWTLRAMLPKESGTAAMTTAPTSARLTSPSTPSPSLSTWATPTTP